MYDADPFYPTFIDTDPNLFSLYLFTILLPLSVTRLGDLLDFV